MFSASKKDIIFIEFYYLGLLFISKSNINKKIIQFATLDN